MSKPYLIHSDHAYDQMLRVVMEAFAACRDKPLFTTSATGLFDALLSALPDEYRQHYTCSACRHFFDHFGGLVWVNDKGQHRCAVLPEFTDGVPEFFRSAVHNMKIAIGKSRITGVFVSKESTLGTPFTGEWHHFHVTDCPVFRSPTLSAGQRAAELRQEHGMISAGLAKYHMPVVERALAFLRSGQLYRADRVLPVAEWLYGLHTRLANEHGTIRENLLWLETTTAPTGFSHFGSGVLSTLMDDILAEASFAALSARWQDKMAPENYQRAQAAPSAGNIQRAEQLVAQLGIQKSLERRYATLDEVEKFWVPSTDARKPAGGVFSGLVAKKKAVARPDVVTPSSTMTWVKFRDTVLPGVRSMQAHIPADSSRFAALVGPVHADAQNILQWDNSYSWYYHGGVDAEMRRRVVAAGGQHDNVDIRATFMWNTGDDLDIHCITPVGGHIYYGNKRVGHGWLDVDANAGGARTRQPVENIRWPKGTAQSGRYWFYVHYFARHEHPRNAIPWAVELEVNGRIYRKEGVFQWDDVKEQHDVFSFDYAPGRDIHLPSSSVGLRPSGWGVDSGAWVDVVGLALSPNLWGANPMPRLGNHVFFLLKGCRDSSEGLGRGLFTETLRPEYREVRSTLEAYFAQSAIAGADAATACGLGMSNTAPWNLRLRVVSELGTAEYLIDRWD